MDKYNKHMNLEDRKKIQDFLNAWYTEGITFSQIALNLEKDATTISKEIKKHREKLKPSSFNNGFNLCKHKYTCTKRDVCNTNCKHRCKECHHCNEFCKDFVKEVCPSLLKPPYVCNGCTNYRYCRFEKYVYNYEKAHNKYLELLSGTRQGLNMSAKEYRIYVKTIQTGIANGQSLAHIFSYNSDLIPCSERTVYEHIEKGLIDVKNIDMRRKVKLKQRKKTSKEIAQVKAIKKGRTYNDFLHYIELHPDTRIVEMDTVIGKQTDDKCILTLLFRDCSLMLCFLLEKHDSEHVNEVFNYLYNLLGEKEFKRYFGVILTDNGTEFSDPIGIEKDYKGDTRTHVFYCQPMRSNQKGKLESNHRLIRYVLPKGTSFENLTQEKLNLLTNHINSYARKVLNYNSPMKLAEILIKKEVLEKLNLSEIAASEILLKPSLLK